MKIASVALVSVLVLAILPGLGLATPEDPLPEADAWPSRGFDRQATNAVSGFISEDTPGIAWTHEANENRASSISQGIVVAGDAGHGALTALVASSGEVLWTFDGSSGTGEGFKASPAIVDGVVYAGHEDGNLYAVDLETGSEEWRFSSASGRFNTAPVEKDGIVYGTDHGGTLYAVDASTGDLVWSSTTDGPSGTRGTPVVNDDTVFVNSFKTDTVLAFDAGTGQEVWTQTMAAKAGLNLAYRDGQIFVGDRGGNVYAMDAATGAIDWSLSTGGDNAWVQAVTDSHIYVGGDDGVAISRSDRTVDWRFEPTNPATSVRRAIVVGNTVVMGTQDPGALYALDRTSGDVRWSFDPGSGHVRDLGYENGRLHVDTTDGAHIVFQMGEPSCRPSEEFRKLENAVSRLKSEKADLTAELDETEQELEKTSRALEEAQERIENLTAQLSDQSRSVTPEVTINVTIEQEASAGQEAALLASVSATHEELPVDAVRLRLDGQGIEVPPDGEVRIDMPEPGEHVLTATYGPASAQETFEVPSHTEEGPGLEVPGLEIYMVLGLLAGLALVPRTLRRG